MIAERGDTDSEPERLRLAHQKKKEAKEKKVFVVSVPPPFIGGKRVKKGTAKARAPQVAPLPVVKRPVRKAAKKVPVVVDFESKEEEEEEEEAVDANSESELSDVDLSE